MNIIAPKNDLSKPVGSLTSRDTRVNQGCDRYMSCVCLSFQFYFNSILNSQQIKAILPLGFWGFGVLGFCKIP